MARYSSCFFLILLTHPMLVTDLLEAGFLALEPSFLRAAHLTKSLRSLLADALCRSASGISGALLAFLTTARFAGLDVHPLLGEPPIKSPSGLIT